MTFMNSFVGSRHTLHTKRLKGFISGLAQVAVRWNKHNFVLGEPD